MKKVLLKSIGILGIIAFMAIGNVSAEDGSTMVASNGTIVIPQPIPLPGGGPIGTTNWGGGGSGGTSDPCGAC